MLQLRGSAGDGGMSASLDSDPAVGAMAAAQDCETAAETERGSVQTR
jgi:hypothetical protein